VRRAGSYVGLAFVAAGCVNPAAQLVGGVCDWRSTADAGVCTDDSECGAGFYCDSTVTECPWDGGSYSPQSVITPGSCLLRCNASPGICTAATCGPCHVGEDCPPGFTCSGSKTWLCTMQEPCDIGTCVLTTGAIPNCAPGCKIIRAPHAPGYYCACIGNTCVVTDAGVVDAGIDSGDDAGTASDAGPDGGQQDGGYCAGTILIFTPQWEEPTFDIAVGSSASRSFEVMDVGNQPIELLSYEPMTSPFHIGGPTSLPVALTPRDAVAFSISYAPTKSGNDTATFTSTWGVQSPSCSETVAITFTGTAY
jgi:hypothetical protein